MLKAGDGPMGRNAIFSVANQETTLWAERETCIDLIASGICCSPTWRFGFDFLNN
jgi:hypothetical protein